MSKAVKLSDIAQMMGVSSVTVSKALSGKKGVSEEMRKKIRDKADELGYKQPSEMRRLYEPRQYTIGVLIAARSGKSGIAVNLCDFIDAIVEGASKCEGIKGIAECAKLPVWAVSRLFGTFPVLQNVYAEAMDEFVMTVEAAAMKSATWNKISKSHMSKKMKTLPNGQSITESTTETDDVIIPPDPTLSKLILQSRMRNRYKEESGSKQAVIINITGPEAGL